VATADLQEVLMLIEKKLTSFNARLDNIEKAADDNFTVLATTVTKGSNGDTSLEEFSDIVTSSIDEAGNTITEAAESAIDSILEEQEEAKSNLHKYLAEAIEAIKTDLNFKVSSNNLDALLEALGGLSTTEALEGVTEALQGLKSTDSTKELSTIAEAIKDSKMSLDLSEIVKTLQENSGQLEFVRKQMDSLVESIDNLNKAVSAEKSVTYDSRGNITGVKIATTNTSGTKD